LPTLKIFEKHSVLSLEMLRKKLNQIKESQLLVGSLVMFVGSMVANLGSYFYHLLAGRMLGPTGYGALESVISLAYLLFIPLNTLTLVVAKFVANFKGEKNYRGIVWLRNYFNKKLLIISTVVMVLIITSSPLVKLFLKLDSVWPTVFVGLLFFISTFSSLDRAILQGLMLFPKMVVSHIGETTSKMIAALLFIWLGFKVGGGVLGLVVGSLIGWWLAHINLRTLRQYSPRRPGLKISRLLNFALPVFLSHLCFTSIYTNDIILVKHFFSPIEAGLYAALAVMGKVVFYATSAIPNVAYPMAAHHKSQGKNPNNILNHSLLIVIMISLGAIGVYLLFPKLMILILYGKEYLPAVPYLVWMGIFIGLYSVAFLYVNYFLSQDKTKIVILPIIAALSQLLLINHFHQSLFQVLMISIIVSGLLVLSLVIYYLYDSIQTKTSLRDRACLP
jgi:O-antigen/teichoic acid export membrane protein